MNLTGEQQAMLEQIVGNHEDSGAMLYERSLEPEDQATVNALRLMGMIEHHPPSIGYLKPTPLGRQTVA
jgi:hypothetical protein